jgi:flagellar hook-associated protein 1 FlgK
MSLFGLFDSGKSALFASQIGLATTSHNIANASTPGYTRQKVLFEPADAMILGGTLVGRGVVAGTIERDYDRFIQAQLLGQQQNYGRSYALEQELSQLEQIFNELEGFGLSTQLDSFFNAWQDVSNDPEGIPQRTVLLQETDALIQKAVKMEANITNQLGYINDNISDIVNDINAIATNIASLNIDIRKVEGVSGAEKANDLRDSREKLLNDLAELISFNSFEDTDGISIIVGGHALVTSDGTNTLSVSVNTEGNNELYLAGSNLTTRITNGQLGGLLAVRDDIESTSLNSMRKLIAAVINEVNMVHAKGFGLDTQASDFTITDITADQFPSTVGSINTATITDFTSFVPGDYQIDINATQDGYDIYKDGTLLSTVAAGGYTAGNDIVINGLTVTFTGAQAANDSFYITARGNNLFNDLSVYSLDLESSAANITSASVFNRASLTYDEYEIRFTNATTYDVYNVDDGVNVITGASYTSGNSIRFDGLEAVITDDTGAPAAGDRFLVSPLENAVQYFSAAITDPYKIAASSTSTGIPGNNINALNMINLAQTQLSDLDSSTMTSYYSQIVSVAGSRSNAAIDNLKFDENLLSRLEFTRQSISGVSIDEETANLIRFQRAYQAGARLIRVADELMEILVNI